MPIHKTEDVIAIQDQSGIYCMDCVDRGNLEAPLYFYEERDRKDEEILVCDSCGIII